jgi:hypothetical protein
MSKDVFKKLTIEAAHGGWILKERNKPAEVFVRWEMLIRRLKLELTSKGEKPKKETA